MAPDQGRVKNSGNTVLCRTDGAGVESFPRTLPQSLCHSRNCGDGERTSRSRYRGRRPAPLDFYPEAAQTQQLYRRLQGFSQAMPSLSRSSPRLCLSAVRYRDVAPSERQYGLAAGLERGIEQEGPLGGPPLLREGARLGLVVARGLEHEVVVQARLPPSAGQIVAAKSGVRCDVIFTMLPDGSKMAWPACTRTSLPLASRR